MHLENGYKRKRKRLDLTTKKPVAETPVARAVSTTSFFLYKRLETGSYSIFPPPVHLCEKCTVHLSNHLPRIRGEGNWLGKEKGKSG